MKNELILATAAMGLLFFGAGCSAMILHAARKGDEVPYKLPVGSRRDEVEAKLGKPITERPLPDGGQVAIYEYRLGASVDPKTLEGAVLMWFPTPYPLGLVVEPFLLPYAIYKAATRPKGEVPFTYGPDGRLLYFWLPPSYGPADEVLAALSHGEIREQCRSEHPAERRDVEAAGSAQGLPVPDYRYQECMVRRLAIWGIE